MFQPGSSLTRFALPVGASLAGTDKDSQNTTASGRPWTSLWSSSSSPPRPKSFWAEGTCVWPCTLQLHPAAFLVSSPPRGNELGAIDAAYDAALLLLILQPWWKIYLKPHISNNLMILHVDQEYTDVNLTEVANEFVSRGDRRIKLFGHF